MIKPCDVYVGMCPLLERHCGGSLLLLREGEIVHLPNCALTHVVPERTLPTGGFVQ